MTGYSFEYDKQHKVMKIAADLAEIDLSPPGAAAGGGSTAHPTPPRGPSRSSSRPIRKFFSAIFGMCKDMNAIKTRQHHER